MKPGSAFCKPVAAIGAVQLKYALLALRLLAFGGPGRVRRSCLLMTHSGHRWPRSYGRGVDVGRPVSVAAKIAAHSLQTVSRHVPALPSRGIDHFC
jgi:hypothetical protein